jgi:hypothetical protein
MMEDLGGPALILKGGVEVFARQVIFCWFSMLIKCYLAWCHIRSKLFDKKGLDV